MVVYSFSIYNRRGVNLFYREWERATEPLADEALAEHHRLVFGLIISMQALCLQLAPRQGQEGLQSFRTNSYMLHYFESPSGVIFAMCTDPNTQVLRTSMWHIFSNLYVPLVTRNPLQQTGHKVTAIKFKSALDEYVGTL